MKYSVSLFCAALITVSCSSGSSVTYQSKPYELPPIYNRNYKDSVKSNCALTTRSNLGFHGIHLGMNKSEVHNVVSCGSVYKPTFFYKDRDDCEFLSSDKPVGCSGPSGEGACRWIDEVVLQYLNDRLIMLGLESPKYSAYKFDSYVWDWASFALAALIEKYGRPTKIYLPIEDLRIDSVDIIGNEKYLYEWKTPSREKIALTVGLYSSGYYSSIKYINDDLYKPPQQSTKRFKSNL